MNHYETLELSPTASGVEIKAAFRRLAKIYHPDMNGTLQASQRMRNINEAYDVLSNVQSRHLYDLSIRTGVLWVQKEETPEEKYKREFMVRKARERREQMLYLIHLKQLFYTWQWRFSVCLFLLGLIFTFDYYWVSHSKILEDVEVHPGNYQTAIKIKFGDPWECHVRKSFYFQYILRNQPGLKLNYSGVFGYPSSFQIKGDREKYFLRETLYTFNNFVSWIILVTSGTVLSSKIYSDFRLTIGLLPFFLLPWLLGMVLTYPF